MLIVPKNRPLYCPPCLFFSLFAGNAAVRWIRRATADVHGALTTIRIPFLSRFDEEFVVRHGDSEGY